MTSKIAAVTGASRGIGYAIGKELAMRLPAGSQVYLTTRGVENIMVMESNLRAEMGSTGVHFRRLNIQDGRSVSKFAEVIAKKHGQLDILVNNASVYYKPPATVPAAGDMLPLFSKEVAETINTNYFGLKAVVRSFLPKMSPTGRITNIGSNFGLVDRICGDEPFSSQLRQAFTDPELTEKELDRLVNSFTQDVKAGRWKNNGWPTCGYTVSKVAMNAYTAVLQRQLDKERPHRDVIVNSVHPGTYHSKMTMNRTEAVSRDNAADTVAYLTTLGLEGIGDTSVRTLPRGLVLWHDLSVIEWRDATRVKEELASSSS